MSIRVGESASAPSFAVASKDLIHNQQLRANVRRATSTIRSKRDRVVAELPDWQKLRESAAAIKEHTLEHLAHYLLQFEAACTRAGGVVHWAQDADDANRIIVEILRVRQYREVIKVKTMTSDEIQLNSALELAGITPHETDLADLIVQLGHDRPSHIVVPALHRDRTEIRDLFRRTMNLPSLSDEPEDLARAARQYLREKFLHSEAAISGANFLTADNGAVCVVESEGNGRMCLTLPKVLITIAGIEKVIPRFADLEVFLQLLPRSATGERMNPYNSIWTGVTPADGPEEFHVVLLDNGRTSVLADSGARSTLDCIRCGACLNVGPVYRQTGGHAYGSIYAGPIGAILTPQLQQMEHSRSLPYASTLCGACYDVCPVKINIPEILVHLRGKLVASGDPPLSERMAMKIAALAFSKSSRLSVAQRATQSVMGPVSNASWVQNMPGPLREWLKSRDLPPMPKESFRQWWRKAKVAEKLV